MNESSPKLSFLQSFLHTPSFREILVLGEGKRHLAYSLEDYSSYLGKVDIYYSTRSYENLITDTWDRFYLDIDAHGKPFSDAVEVARRAIKALVELGLNPTVIYTGRGYHIYILLSEPVEIDYEQLKPYWKELGSDIAVLNKNPMARLPFTINSKVGKEAIPVNPENLSDIDYSVRLNEPRAFVDAFSLGGLITETRQIVRKVVFERGASITPPLCIREMLSRAVATGYLSHLERFSFATFSLRVWGYERTRAFFRLMDDYNKRETSYQLRHIASRRYMFPKCRTIMYLGACNEGFKLKCPFYPWLEPYLPPWEVASDEGQVGGI
jgi:hypothetical protein